MEEHYGVEAPASVFMEKKFKRFVSRCPILNIVAKVDDGNQSFETFREFLSDFGNHGFKVNLVAEVDRQQTSDDVPDYKTMRLNSVSTLTRFLDHCLLLNVLCDASIVDKTNTDSVLNHARKTNSHLIFDTTTSQAKPMTMKTVSETPVGFHDNDSVFAYLCTLPGRSFIPNFVVSQSREQ